MINPLSANPHKMLKHTQTIHRQKPINCLSLFDHFVGLALKDLKEYVNFKYYIGVHTEAWPYRYTINPTYAFDN